MRAFYLTPLVALSLVLLPSDALAVSVKNFRELVAFYSAATGVPATEPKVQQAYLNVKTRLPKAGTVEEFSSPAVLGALELSGAFCNAFITAEAAAQPQNRRVHQTIDFTKTPSQLADADVLAVARSYARIFWLRDARKAEDATFQATIGTLKSITPNTAAGTKQLSLILCTQIATSLDALVTR
jgi:hypothetical protein